MKSKTLAALAVVLIIILICVTYPLRLQWWAFTDVFCFFMSAFIHLLATLQPPALAAASRKLDMVALVFAVLGVAALIVEGAVYFFV